MVGKFEDAIMFSFELGGKRRTGQREKERGEKEGKGDWSEDICLDDAPPLTMHGLDAVIGRRGLSTDRYLQPGRFRTYTSLRAKPLVDYPDLVNTYTARSFSYDADVLKAVLGILIVIYRFGTDSFLCGLSRNAFPASLFWMPYSKLRRRKAMEDGLMFPTWSWAAWQGPVIYETRDCRPF